MIKKEIEKMKKMKVAQIGVGNFGRRRREIMRQSGLFEIVAAYDLNPKALEQCQAEDGAVPVGSYEELLDTPDIEAVIISTGAKFHAEQITAAAKKGLNVFVEKPLCATWEEANDLLEVQRQTGVVVGVGHLDHSHDAISIKIKDMIDSGQLGNIATFERTTAHSGGLKIKPGDWRGDPKKNPGGMLFQCGVHAVHELIYYFGPVEEVFSMMSYDVHTTETADVALCQLRFASGIIGTLNAYHVTPYRHTLNIFGTEASIYRDERYFSEGDKLSIQHRDPAGQYEPHETVLIDSSLTDITGGMRSFYNAVCEGDECYPSLLDGARAVSAVFAAEKSAKTGKPVKVTMV